VARTRPKLVKISGDDDDEIAYFIFSKCALKNQKPSLVYCTINHGLKLISTGPISR